ncbi:MAG: hypothetical protein DRN30_04175 [Thermoplasmata archaeon]|nr:MAG: hypothetical protein DRN30_04175 [Thermoplasmata archaeon]
MTDETEIEIQKHETRETMDAPIYFDVDETLVLWNWDKELDCKKITILTEDDGGYTWDFVPHQPHIDKMIEHFNRGCKIYVWSQGGEDWARKVVDELGLNAYVTNCMTKPAWIYDDMPATNWCNEDNRVYLDPVTGEDTKDVLEINEYALKTRDFATVAWKKYKEAEAEIKFLKEQLYGEDYDKNRKEGKGKKA